MSARAPLDCADVLRQLWDYLDGELDPARVALIEAHLVVCRRCPEHVRFERAFLDAVRRGRREHEGAAALTERVVAALAGAGLGR